MTDREKLARQWAELVKSVPQSWHSKECRAAAEHILATTTPPTMEGREWVHAEHHMTGADWDSVPVVMIDPDNDRSTIVLGLEEEKVYSAEDKDLTPNGKRYKLVEVPDHPEVLETEEDYENALEGTVAAVGYSIWVKNSYGAWSAGNGAYSNGAMAKYECTVLRWGPGGEA